MKLTEVIAIWDKLHVKDTGELGYCDLEAAIAKVVGVDNDVPADQPASLDKIGRTLIPVDQLIAAINQLATRPRGHNIECDAAELEAVAYVIDTFGAMLGKPTPPDITVRIREVVKKMLDYQ
jgi:hypothetical protein